jgi:RND family efflux transporter, MFP subunit
VLAAVGGLAYPKVKPMLADKPAAVGGKAATPSRSGQPLKVKTFLVEPTLFAETISATGTVRADESVELQAEISGKVVSINFTEGTLVKKDDLLVKLNDSDLRANLERYRHSKDLAEVRFRRYAQLFTQKVVTQDDYDSAVSEMNVQQSFIDLYEAQIEKTEIRAPFDGVVGLRYVSVGALVTASTQIATLQRLDELKIDFSVPEKYAGRIKVGSEIRFSVADGLRQYAGRIYAIDPRIDSGTRSLMVRAVGANPDGSLLPGAFTNVVVPLQQLADAVLIPAEAVIPGLDEKNVFVLKDGVAQRRAVETGVRTSTQVHILSGLQPGDRVITSGLQTMRANQPVEALNDPNLPVRDAAGEPKTARPAGSAASVDAAADHPT